MDEPMPSAPPPSYEDVVAAGSSVVVSASPPPAVAVPSAPSFPPPPSHIRRTSSPQGAGNTSRSHQQGGGQQQSHGGQLPRQTSRQYTRTSLQHMQTTRSTGGSHAGRRLQQQTFLEKLARFNMPAMMLTGLLLPSVNVELDSEAHLPHRHTAQRRAKRRQRLKCFCSWLWCCGFTLLFFLVAVPVAMLLTGVFGTGSCPFQGNIILVCQIITGCIILATLMLRLFNSSLSCCKIGNMCDSDKSIYCTTCVGIMEAFFVVALILTAMIVLLSTWFTLQQTPSFTMTSSTTNDYCQRGVYYAAIILLSLTYLLGFTMIIYLALAGICYYTYQDELETKQRRKRRQRPRNASL